MNDITNHTIKTQVYNLDKGITLWNCNAFYAAAAIPAIQEAKYMKQNTTITKYNNNLVSTYSMYRTY